jgi:uncharacterized OsmC-like protein
MTTVATEKGQLNGVNLSLLHKLLEDVKGNRVSGVTRWGVSTRWVSGAQSESEVKGYEINGQHVARSFRFRTDEPKELAGGNQFPNPQEYLLGALNACMVVGYVALSTLYGIELESLAIETEGEIDLRGFLGLSKEVKPGYDEIHYRVKIKGNGTEAQFREIHEFVTATSPNRFNLSQPVKLTSELIVQ